MKSIDSSINFPLTLTWEDGSTQTLSDIADIECNLEDFDSSDIPECVVKDANGAVMKLRVSMMWIQELKRVSASE